MGAEKYFESGDIYSGTCNEIRGKPDPTLDEYSRDLTLWRRRAPLIPVVGREEEIGRVMQILSRRTKIIHALSANRVSERRQLQKDLPREFPGGLYRILLRISVVTLDLSGMVAGPKIQGEFGGKNKECCKKASENKNILLFIDELHTIIGAGGAEGALDASNILKPSLSRGEIQIIGATTIDEYRKYIEKMLLLNGVFSRLWLKNRRGPVLCNSKRFAPLLRKPSRSPLRMMP